MEGQNKFFPPNISLELYLENILIIMETLLMKTQELDRRIAEGFKPLKLIFDFHISKIFLIIFSFSIPVFLLI